MCDRPQKGRLFAAARLGSAVRRARIPRRSGPNHLRCLLLALLFLLGAPRAQHFTVSAPEGDVTAASLQTVERLVEAGIGRVAALIPGTPKNAFAVHVHRSASSVPPELSSVMHPGAPAFALLGRQEIHLLIDEVRDLRNTIDHELVHILLHQHAGPAGMYVPRWFHEGLAQSIAGETYLGASEEALVFRAATKTLIPFRELVADFPHDDDVQLQTAYGQSYSFVSFLRRRVGLGVLLESARRCSPSFEFRQAFAQRMDRAMLHFEQEWSDWLIHESGAPWRLLLRNCFDYCMLLAVPMFLIAWIKKRTRERRIRDRLAADDETSILALPPPQEAP